MRLSFLLLFLLFCFAYGAPPEKCRRYTPEEEAFLIKELEYHKDLFNRNMWKAIADAHENKVKEKAPGFFVKRSRHGLRRFLASLIKKHGVTLPHTLKLLREEKVTKPYSKEEDEFINRDLLTIEGTVHSDDLWAEMERRHDKKREDGDFGFSNVRNANGLRLHFVKTMVQKNRVDEAVKEKFSDYFKKRQESAIRSQQSIPNENAYKYSLQENKFLIEMLEERAGMYTQDTWKVIEEAHRNNVEANVPGFVIPRSARGLYQYFIKMMKKKIIEVPAIVRQLYEEYMNTYYNDRETEFINAELLKYYGGNLFSVVMWKHIEKEHDQKRLSDCPGFHNKRTWNSLRTYCNKRMLLEGLVDEAVKQKFQSYFRRRQGSTFVERKRKFENDLIENAEGVSDGGEDVSVDEHGVDRSLFLDRRASGETDFFETQSPDEPHTLDSITP